MKPSAIFGALLLSLACSAVASAQDTTDTTPEAYTTVPTAYQALTQTAVSDLLLSGSSSNVSPVTVADVVSIYAQTVLRQDETESEEFVADFETIAVELGFASSEDVTAKVGVQILLYLSLQRILGLPSPSASS